MTPGLVTVVGVGWWEAELVAAARASGLARVLGRCLEPEAVEARLRAADVVAVGTETPWMTTDRVRRWRQAGVAVVAVVDPADRAGGRLAEAWGCDAVVSASGRGMELLTQLVALVPPPTGAPPAPLFTVTGPRGSPGRSEVALTLAVLAAEDGPAALVELDPSPTLGLRLGLAPGVEGTNPEAGSVVTCDGVTVVARRPGRGPLSEALAARVVEAARGEHRAVVVDAGPDVDDATSNPVIVCCASPPGLVRIAALVARWRGTTPQLVVNHAPEDPVAREAALRAVRAASGLEPSAMLPTVADLIWGGSAHPALVEALRPLLQPDAGGAAG